MAALPGMLAALLLAYFWWQGERFLEANGPTFDEGAHLAAGYGYWRTGDLRMNHEDPPLLKWWWALPLVVGERPPYPQAVAEATNRDHWHVGLAFLYDSGVPYQRLLKPARRMNLALGCGIVLLAGWWASRLWQCRFAGLAAMAFAAFDPNLLALSCALSTDAGFAFFALLSSYLLWEYAARPTRGLLFAAGISLGLMLGSKLSAIAMVVGFGFAGTAFVLRGGVLVLPGRVLPQEGAGPRLRAYFDLLFRLGVIAAIVLAATYGFLHFDEWGRGLKFQLTRADHGDGRMYLNGQLSKSGWFHYFLVASAVKVPSGLLAAAFASAIIQVKERPSKRSILVWLPPLIFFAAASYSRVDLGIRVVLPALVFLPILAGGLVSSIGWHRLPAGAVEQRHFGWHRLPAGASCALFLALLGWAGWASWQASPHQIAYFNEIAGDRGLDFVADSNADWGQGLPLLKAYIERERIETVYLSYFGTDRPEAYGIRYQSLPGYGRVGPAGGESIPPDAARHVLAISANNLLGIYLDDPATFAWLRSRKPDAILGGSLFVFDLTGDAEAIRRLRSGP